MPTDEYVGKRMFVASVFYAPKSVKDPNSDHPFVPVVETAQARLAVLPEGALSGFVAGRIQDLVPPLEVLQSGVNTAIALGFYVCAVSRMGFSIAGTAEMFEDSARLNVADPPKPIRWNEHEPADHVAFIEVAVEAVSVHPPVEVTPPYPTLDGVLQSRRYQAPNGTQTQSVRVGVIDSGIHQRYRGPARLRHDREPPSRGKSRSVAVFGEENGKEIPRCPGMDAWVDHVYRNPDLPPGFQLDADAVPFTGLDPLGDERGHGTAVTAHLLELAPPGMSVEMVKYTDNSGLRNYPVPALQHMFRWVNTLDLLAGASGPYGHVPSAMRRDPKHDNVRLPQEPEGDWPHVVLCSWVTAGASVALALELAYLHSTYQGKDKVQAVFAAGNGGMDDDLQRSRPRKAAPGRRKPSGEALKLVVDQPKSMDASIPMVPIGHPDVISVGALTPDLGDSTYFEEFSSYLFSSEDFERECPDIYGLSGGILTPTQRFSALDRKPLPCGRARHAALAPPATKRQHRRLHGDQERAVWVGRPDTDDDGFVLASGTSMAAAQVAAAVAWVFAAGVKNPDVRAAIAKNKEEYGLLFDIPTILASFP